MTLAHLRSRLRDQCGATSVSELAVVALLIGAVSAIIMTSVTSSIRTASAVQDQNTSIQEVRTALEIIERDLRAANPIDAVEPVSLYATSLSFSVYCATPGVAGCGTDNLRDLTYRLNGNRLERLRGATTGVLAAPSGPSHLPVAQQRGAIVNTSAEPVFRYFDRDGNELATTGGGASPPSHFRDCVRHVEIFLRIVTEPGSSPKTATIRTSGTLRNFNEVAGC